jgi:hypothetical protein
MKMYKEAKQYPVTIELPLKFWLDHKNRDCSPSSIELKRNKVYVTVQLDEEAWSDIYGDAEFYATYFDGGNRRTEDEAMMVELEGSAKATLKRLNAQV